MSLRTIGSVVKRLVVYCFLTMLTLVDLSIASCRCGDDIDVKSHDNPSFSFSNVTVSQVFKQLKKLDVNKAIGFDDISARLLKAGAVSLSTPLTHIFNVSLRTGIVPSKWKISRVTPLSKDGPRRAVGNYRHISVIYTCCNEITRKHCP